MLLEDIGDYLETSEIEIGTQGTDLFLGDMPAYPDNCIALYEYAGQPPDLHWDGSYPSLQVKVRNTEYSAGRTKIESIKTLLHGLAETTLGTTRYLLIKANQSPFHLGKDENNRHLFVVNFSIIMEG